MKTVETILPAGRIVEIKELPGGSYKVVQEIAEEVVYKSKGLSDADLILIEAESLSWGDEFMDYLPQTKKEGWAKDLIAEAIKSHVKNFYRPNMDPSFTADGIGYVAGNKPAVGKSYAWWSDTAKKYDPSRNSRLGTRLEYGAFLGVLIKKLVEEGKSVEWAWNAVCNDSKELGHYWNSEDAKHEFEPTGSRCICGFYDLANTYKILAEDEENGGFCFAGGACCDGSGNYPIACIRCSAFSYGDYDGSVGWIVLS